VEFSLPSHDTMLLAALDSRGFQAQTDGSIKEVNAEIKRLQLGTFG